ncbi:hypothetical protein, partial [Sphingomonas sp.]|uniref:hypothetical protein n=1 Tax=Sphingomonas sp. TaxID=28214 RepID=UPI0035BC59B4
MRVYAFDPQSSVELDTAIINDSRLLKNGCLRRCRGRDSLLQGGRGITDMMGRQVAQGALFYGFRLDE